MQISAVRGYILFAFAVALALALAWRLRTVLELIYVSALFAVVLMPLVESIMRLKIRKWSPSRPVAVIFLVAAVFAAFALLIIFALPPVIHDVQRFTANLPSRVTQVVSKLKRIPLADKFGVDSLAQKSESTIAATAQYILASAPMWLSHLLDLAAALVLCIYFMLEGEFAYFYLLSFFSEKSRTRLAKTMIVAEVRVSKWLVGQAMLMLILGVCSTIAFAVLHVHYFFVLGLIMGLFNIIPVAGGVISILLAGAIAATESWSKMAGVFIFYAIYVQIENGYLIPRIMRSSVNLMGLSVLIALLAGSELAGVVGALVAVPSAALVAVVMDEYFVQADADALAEEQQLRPPEAGGQQPDSETKTTEQSTTPVGPSDAQAAAAARTQAAKAGAEPGIPPQGS
ncbi:MAG: AI-2E family transporter [Acidobacteria bacterium]|nr:AI-2E family transporter [Acidobacteriota bacterium]